MIISTPAKTRFTHLKYVDALSFIFVLVSALCSPLRCYEYRAISKESTLPFNLVPSHNTQMMMILYAIWPRLIRLVLHALMLQQQNGRRYA